MTIGTSLFLIALGAVLRFAVTVSTKGFNLHTVGVIMMLIGAEVVPTLVEFEVMVPRLRPAVW